MNEETKELLLADPSKWFGRSWADWQKQRGYVLDEFESNIQEYLLVKEQALDTCLREWQSELQEAYQALVDNGIIEDGDVPPWGLAEA